MSSLARVLIGDGYVYVSNPHSGQNDDKNEDNTVIRWVNEHAMIYFTVLTRLRMVGATTKDSLSSSQNPLSNDYR